MKDILLEKNSFLAYLWASLRGTTLWSIGTRAAAYARRFLFITRIAHYISLTVAVIESSVILVLLAALLVVLVPIALAALIAALIADTIIGRRILQSKALADALEREHVYVIARAGPFGEGFARELAASGAAVFIITADIRRRFISARQYDGIWYVRHAFFFRLKRKKLSPLSAKLQYLL